MSVHATVATEENSCYIDAGEKNVSLFFSFYFVFMRSVGNSTFAQREERNVCLSSSLDLFLFFSSVCTHQTTCFPQKKKTTDKEGTREKKRKQRETKKRERRQKETEEKERRTRQKKDHVEEEEKRRCGRREKNKQTERKEEKKKKKRGGRY